jgi:hypothetical protein
MKQFAKTRFCLQINHKEKAWVTLHSATTALGAWSGKEKASYRALYIEIIYIEKETVKIRWNSIVDTYCNFGQLLDVGLYTRVHCSHIVRALKSAINLHRSSSSIKDNDRAAMIKLLTSFFSQNCFTKYTGNASSKILISFVTRWQKGWVVGRPTSYCGSPGLKSLPWNLLTWHFSRFFSFPPVKCWDSTAN